MREEKRIVKEFYDSFGWQKNADGVYKDTAEYVDLRPVLREYYHMTSMREKEFLKPHGKYFLDAGSGAIISQEALEYSSGYNKRVCVDFSANALVEARSKLKDRGLYVVADLTKLPFKDNIFDTTLCEHVLYHIPEDEQKTAILELYRTLKDNSNCVIIYQRSNKIKQLVLKIPGIHSLWRRIKNVRRKVAKEKGADSSTRPPIYYKAHDYYWLKKTFSDNWDTDIRCWRSLSYTASRIFVPDNYLGRFLLKALFTLESKFPHFFARIGRYPMIIIRKQ